MKKPKEEKEFSIECTHRGKTSTFHFVIKKGVVMLLTPRHIKPIRKKPILTKKKNCE